MYVDDDEMILELGKEMLEDCGYNVIQKSCCLEALDLIQVRPMEIDIIITDYEMPSMNGKQFAEKVKQFRNDIPIIMATAKKDIDETMLYDAGINELITKPYEAEEIELLIKALTVGFN